MMFEEIRMTMQDLKREFTPSGTGWWQILFVRPRLFIFLAINYFLFWFQAGLPAAYNIYTLGIYIIVIALSLSSVAEWIFRHLENVRRVATYTEKERLLELFDSVKARAMKHSTMIDERVKLYIVDSMSINAFSLGRRTIAITRGLMATMRKDEELEAIIAHEMAHIINGDTQVSMLVTIASNVYIWAIMLVAKVLAFIETMAGGTSFISSLCSFVRNLLELALKYVILAFTILVASASRKEEYKADLLACELGYGEGLLEALYKFYDIEMSNNRKLLDRLQASHPIVAYRIEAIEKRFLDEDTDE